jgi:hypothetical protein
MNPQMEYHTVSGNKWTLEDKPVMEWVRSHIEGRVYNPCCGKTELDGIAEIRNDIDTSVPADTHLDIHESLKLQEDKSYTTILFDPPWSGFQSGDKYDGGEVNWTKDIKEEFNRILKPRGRLIQIGYSTVAMPGRLEYDRTHVAVFQPYGRRKAFYGTLDVKRPRLGDNYE